MNILGHMTPMGRCMMIDILNQCRGSGSAAILFLKNSGSAATPMTGSGSELRRYEKVALTTLINLRIKNSVHPQLIRQRTLP